VNLSKKKKKEEKRERGKRKVWHFFLTLRQGGTRFARFKLLTKTQQEKKVGNKKLGNKKEKKKRRLVGPGKKG